MGAGLFFVLIGRKSWVTTAEGIMRHEVPFLAHDTPGKRFQQISVQDLQLANNHVSLWVQQEGRRNTE